MPMSLSETREDSSAKTLDDFLYEGLYPAICAKRNVARLFYPSYVKTYIEKDVRDVLKIKDLMLFLKFMKLCAARVGSIFNASEISNEVGVDNKTNAGKEGGVFYYRDSNQNEVDLLLKEEGETKAYEIKSSMTYTTEFEKTIKKLPKWLSTPVVSKSIIYAGPLENSVADIKLINYKNLSF